MYDYKTKEYIKHILIQQYAKMLADIDRYINTNYVTFHMTLSYNNPDTKERFKIEI